MRAVRASVALTLLGVSGCQWPFSPGACTTEARPGLRIAVLDSATGASLVPARVVASAGVYADTAVVITGSAPTAATDATYGLAHERPGVYSVTVERAGFRPWHRDGIRVRAGECHVRTVEMTARLQQIP